MWGKRFWFDLCSHLNEGKSRLWRPKPTSLVVRERVDDGDKGRNDEGDGADSTIVTDIYFCLAMCQALC